jgi:hypothetical protein
MRRDSMNDLISRKALLKEFGIDDDTPDVAKILIAVTLKDIEKKISNQPTAYDVDKVAEQLENAEIETTEEPHAINAFRAIEIVKEGAVKDE